MADRIQHRRDKKATWESVNPVLLEGEIGLVLDDPNLYKVGDGTKKWTELPYRGFNGTVAQELGTSQDAVMSQKAVTDAVRNMNGLTYIDGKSTYASSLIREIYVYRTDGEPVNIDIYVRTIYNNVAEGFNGKLRWNITFSDAESNAIFAYSVSYPKDTPGYGVVTLSSVNSSPYIGLAVLDWDSFNSKFPEPFNIQTMSPLEKLSKKAYTLDENPMIRKYVEDNNAYGEEYTWQYIDALCQPSTTVSTVQTDKLQYQIRTNNCRNIIIKGRLSPHADIGGDCILFYSSVDKIVKTENVEIENVYTYELEIPDYVKYVNIRVKKGTGYFLNVILEKRVRKVNHFKANADSANNTFWQEQSTLFFVPIYGQSLSVGAATGNALSTTTKYPGMWMTNLGVVCNRKAENEFQGFLPLVEETDRETPASGLAEKAIETLQQMYGISPYDTDFWGTHKIVVACLGRGSTGIDDLKEGTEDFNGFVNFMTAMERLAEEFHFALRSAGFVWMQGERDIVKYGEIAEDGVSKYGVDYDTKLSNLISALQKNIPELSMSEASFSMFIYQTSPTLRLPEDESRPNEEDRFPTLILNVQSNNRYYCFCPMYAVQHSSKSHEDSVHLSALGSKITGAYAGIQIIKRCFLYNIYTRINPNVSSVGFSTNRITIPFYNCAYPLKFDTLHVAKAENYGFRIYQDAADGGGKRERVEISEVNIFWEGTLEIKTKTAMDKSKHVKVYYGYNDSNSSATPNDGPINGSRGNLCGSEDTLYKIEINGSIYDLPFWVYAFNIDIPTT